VLAGATARCIKSSAGATLAQHACFFFIPQIQHEPSEDAAQQGRSKQTIGALIVVAAASGF